MIPLFLGLTAVNLLFLTITTILGYLSVGRPSHADLHVLIGALSTIACCGVHCIVFTYFIATAKWIRHAIVVKRLDPKLIDPTRSFKAQAFPAAITAMTVVFFAAIAGAAVPNYGLPLVYHHLLAIASVMVNILVAAVEFTAIRRNAQLIDQILVLIAAQHPAV